MPIFFINLKKDRCEYCHLKDGIYLHKFNQFGLCKKFVRASYLDINLFYCYYILSLN